MTLDLLLSKLWNVYTEQNQSAKKVYDLFINHGEEVVNDHIAFRTFNYPAINIDKIAQTFIRLGYREVEAYEFPEKKLKAKHYEHTVEGNYPLIFISELITSEFSEFLQSVVHECSARVENRLVESGEILYSGNVWGPPSYKIYRLLLEESEYAAWLYYNGFCANHFTVSVNHLKNFESLNSVNLFLKNNGFDINVSGGEIKGTPEMFLEQSSTKADLIKGIFVEGEFGITGCYYEFAKRYKMPDGKIFKGFIANSADKIFESTNIKY